MQKTLKKVNTIIMIVTPVIFIAGMLLAGFNIIPENAGIAAGSAGLWVFFAAWTSNIMIKKGRKGGYGWLWGLLFAYLGTIVCALLSPKSSYPGKVFQKVPPPMPTAKPVRASTADPRAAFTIDKVQIPAVEFDRTPLNLVSADAQAEFDKKLEVIKKYLQHLAQDWWKGQPADRETAVCDSCGQEIRRGGGFLVGTNLWCGGCYNDKAELWAKQRGIQNVFTAGTEEKAFAWRAENLRGN